MRTIAEWLDAARRDETSIGQTALAWQAQSDALPQDEVFRRMLTRLHVMRGSVQAGLQPSLRSVSGMVGGQAAKLAGGKLHFGLMSKACAYALSTAECNACMGQIVAAPTAGSCGILPGALLAAQEAEGFTDQELTLALFAAAAIGRVIATQATISGAEGGCQAECGAAAGMAASALTQLYGGSPAQVCDACGFALMNMLGLVCDPVHGLVEIPCVYRNVGGVTQAFGAAELALAGIACPLPCDEVILAMRDVGRALPPSLRETGEGGCAACRSAR